MPHTKRSTMAVLERAKDFLSGEARRDGSRVEWGQDAYAERTYALSGEPLVVACTMGALAMAEVDLWYGETYRVADELRPYYGTGFALVIDTPSADRVQTSEALAATKALATTISEQFADRLPGKVLDQLRTELRLLGHLTDTSAHMVVTTFNDHADTTVEDVRVVVDKAIVGLYA